ncbi:TetR/AcrR family transcriptional regulator [Nocardioides caldifontis]|uniref:TetR/AcrR family transcriptional regulator n=1 Tax=Nocardioides caldifontis TaxID=2588938 RepID=UPI001396AB44|nr:TetR/AcrR family transcriptional regulator [Nocardioides caldifontis]
MDAALRVAAVHGYGGTTVKNISEESGLPASSLYWHFGDKERLLAAALERGFALWGQGLAHGESLPPELEVAVRERFRRGVRAVVDNPAAWRLGLVLSLQAPGEEARARQAFVDVHRRAVDALAGWWLGLLPEEIADPALAHRLSASFLALLDGLFVASSSTDDWDLDALADRFARGLVAHVRRLQREAS